jgi:4-hydroxy-tetrahydrodipicolinate synthase
VLTEKDISGIFIPLITPFNQKGEIDSISFEHYIQQLPLSDIQGIVLNGTTGESPTVSMNELESIFRIVQARLGSTPIPCLLGTGTNDTAGTIKRTEQAGFLGADAALVVVPYYSRPSQEGIIEHYRQVAQVGVPIMVYDIPGRTGVSLTVDTVRAIFEIEGVVGLKDSTGSVQMVSALSAYDAKPILCGEDLLFYEALLSGASGGMLASANIGTSNFVKVYQLFVAGKHTEAKQLFESLLPLIRLLFKESNPAPLKWLLAQQGKISSDQLRLPMMQIGKILREELQQYIQEQ